MAKAVEVKYIELTSSAAGGDDVITRTTRVWHDISLAVTIPQGSDRGEREGNMIHIRGMKFMFYMNHTY